MLRFLCVGSTLLLAGLVQAETAAEDLTVAYIGDQGVHDPAEAVLQLIVDEGVDLLVLQGDMGYGDHAADWIDMMERVLPDDFPVLSVAGNHDRDEWAEYEAWLQRRVDASDGLACDGNLGVKAHCRFAGLSIVQSAPGIREVSPLGPDDDYASYINDEFDGDPAQWRICSFHKNQTRMQTGSKADATGWGVYEACGDAGAMIVTGHEHAYSRTWLLDDFENQHVVHRENRMALAYGQSIAIVSGLGGYQAREQVLGGDWWASIYTADQGAVAGALFCRYGEEQALCEFKSIDGAVPDSFVLTSQVGREEPPEQTEVEQPSDDPLADEEVEVAARVSENAAEDAAVASTGGSGGGAALWSSFIFALVRLAGRLAE